MDRFDRIFELNRLLQGARQPVSRRRLEEALECSRATVKRIIEDMRDYLNAPIVYDRVRNGYRYDPGEGEMYELPGLWFNASELHALLSVQQLLEDVQPGLLDPHLRPLKRRIDELLRGRPAGSPGGSHLGSGGLAGRIRFLTVAARSGGDCFPTVAGALAAGKRLEISYFRRASGEHSRRQVSAQRLVYYRDNWYLDAWCHLRQGLRTFALDAIAEARQLPVAAREVPASDLEAHHAASYGIFAGAPSHLAVLRFEARRALWVAKERWHKDQEGRFLDDGRYELRVPYGNALELVMDVLKYGPEVEVVAPAELRREVAERLAAAAALYRDAGANPGPARAER